VSDYLNNRELAAFIWISVIASLISLLPKAKDVRKCLRNLIAQAFIKKFNVVYALMLSYIALILFGLSKIDLWDLTQSKTTIFWILLSAIPTIFKTNSFRDGNITFKSLVFDNFKLVAIVGVMVNSYVFGIVVELTIVPILAVLEKLIVVCEDNKTQEHRLAHKFLNTSIGIIAFLLILHAFYSLYTNPEALLTKQAIFDFLLPIALTIAFIPFLYCLVMYSIYESIFISLNRFIKDPSLRKRTKYKAILSFNFRTQLLERWQKYAICKSMNSYDEIESSFKEILRINRNEKRENKVSIKDGWSPRAAKEFLIEKNLKVGYYNPPQYPEYDKNWFACSIMLQIDDGLPSNNISYHIEGGEGLVKSLKLFMNINNKKNATDAHNKFFEIANLLCKKALNLDLSNNIKKSLLNKRKVCKENHENSTITVEKDEWETGNGYSISFSIINQLALVERR